MNHAQSSWARVCRCWCGACSTLYYYSRFSIPLHIQFVIRKYFIQFSIFVLLVFLLPSRFSPRFFCISRQWRIFWLATNSPIFIMPLDCIPRIYYYLYTMWTRSTEVSFFADSFSSRNLTINRWSIIYYSYYHLRYLKYRTKVLAKRKIAKLKVDYIVASLLRLNRPIETNVDGIETKTTFIVILLVLFKFIGYISYCRVPRFY